MDGVGGFGFELVALFVIGGDDGLEGGEIDLEVSDASPGELKEKGQLGFMEWRIEILGRRATGFL